MSNTTNTVPTVTLQTAILLQVKEFASSNKKFSAHDITKSLRDKCNNGQMEIPEAEDVSGADNYRFDISHEKVRDLFNEMRDNGVFDVEFVLNRQFNGRFFDYTAQLQGNVHNMVHNPPYVSVNSPSLTVPTTIGVDAEIERRVSQYLTNCKSRDFRPTIKQVQSAIKRNNTSTGVSWGELEDIIKNLGYSLSGNGNRSQVIL